MCPEFPMPQAVRLTRVFDAPVELVYRAWTEAEHVVKWMKCDADATLEVENWVPEVGVEFETYMVQPGVFEARGKGRFTAVEPPHLLEYVQYADPKLGVPEMTVRVELQERDGGTALTLTHTGIPSHFCGMIDGGWTSSLSQLESVLANLTVPSEASP